MKLTDTLGTLIIYVTHKCNLKCSYCLNSFNNSENGMDLCDTPDYLPKIAKFINTLEQETIDVVFFGGEPTVRWDICKDMYYYLIDNVKDKNLRFIIQTNGTLIHELIDDLKVMDRLKISVSMDADKFNHDKFRVFHDDSKSYDLIVDNIKLLIANGLQDRLNVSACFYLKDSAQLADRLISVLEMGVNKIRTTAIKEAVFHDEDFPAYYKALETMAEYLVDHPDKCYYKFGLSPINDKPGFFEVYKNFKNNIGSDTCKAGVYRTFINTNGDMFPCSTLMEPHNKLGNMFTGEINFPLAKKFHQFYSSNCNGCKLRGGCQFCMYKMYYDTATMFRCSDTMVKFCQHKKDAMNYFYSLCEKRGYLDDIDKY